MNMFEIDFISGDHWFTYDVYANDIFSAACSIMRVEKNSALITNITFIKKTFKA